VPLKKSLYVGTPEANRSIAEFDYRQFFAGDQLIDEADRKTAHFLGSFEFS
jgi:hypothetical protein